MNRIHRGGGGEVSTATQAVSTSHYFSLAPDGGPTKGEYWEAAEVVTDSNGDVYYAGTVSQGAEIKFGCGTGNNPQLIDPPMGSRDEAFLVKFDASGNCVWQQEFKSDVTDPSKVRFNYSAKDLTLSPSGNPVIVLEIGRDEPNGKHYNRYPGVVEFSSSGASVWSDILTKDLTRDSTFVLEAIGTSEDRLFAAGRTNHSVDFTGSTIKNGPLLILGWGALNNNQNRPRKWIKEFGGRQTFPGRRVQDLAVGPEGRAVIVGNYGYIHYHLDGTQADNAHNSNMFIQVVDKYGQPDRQWASSGSPTYDHDTEIVRAVDFAPDGTLFVGGAFQGYLNPQLELGGGSAVGYMPTGNPGATNPVDRDIFLLEFDGVSDLPNKSTAGSGTHGYASQWYGMTPGGQKTIHDEELRDLEAGPSWVSFTGTACDADIECVQDDAYVHVFDRSTFPSNGMAYSLITRTFSNSGEAFIGKNVALDTVDERVLVSGLNTDTNYSLGGSSTLPGSDDFLVSYDLIP